MLIYPHPIISTIDNACLKTGTSATEHNGLRCNLTCVCLSQYVRLETIEKTHHLTKEFAHLMNTTKF